MSDQQFKVAKTPHETFIYPYPVDKASKYLIIPRNERETEVLLTALQNGFLKTPLEDSGLYQSLGLHKDGQTPKYKIEQDKFMLNLLPHREHDPERASIIENLLSKKVLQFIEGEIAAQKIRFRYQKQCECSECQKLGIEDPKLSKWIDYLCQLSV